MIIIEPDIGYNAYIDLEQGDTSACHSLTLFGSA